MDLSNGAQYTETCSYNTDWSVIVHVHMGQLLLIKQNLKHVSHIPAAVFLKANDISQTCQRRKTLYFRSIEHTWHDL